MISDKIIWYFLPSHLRNKLHPDYDQVTVLISGFLISGVLLFVLPIPILFFSPVVAWFFVMSFFSFFTCFAIKFGCYYTHPTYLLFTISLTCIFYMVVQTGGILSPYTAAIYGIVLTGSWAGKPFSKFAFTGLIICLFAISSSFLFEIWEEKSVSDTNSKLVTALLLHLSLTIFFSVFFWMLKSQNDKIRLQIKDQQINRISELDKAVKERNAQLSTIRQNLATDFHDETGNMLAAITRQAGLLKLKLQKDHPEISTVENIIQNSENLYASSRDFLWSVHHESDDPNSLFTYLTGFGQLFYNQFDVAFSASENRGNAKYLGGHLPPFASRQLIFIFKEAMTNVVKHSGANEVIFTMELTVNTAIFCLFDNGKWKTADENTVHNGIKNIRKRVAENGFDLKIKKKENGSSLIVACPLIDPYT